VSGNLTDLQQAILDFIWTGGAAAAECARRFSNHPLKDSSIRTLLRRLEARGYLRHRLDAKVYLYEAAVPSQGVAAQAVRQIIGRLCVGSVEQSLTGMVEEKVLPVAQIERLARKVKNRK
jgi:predicted transcriptional regulator